MSFSVVITAESVLPAIKISPCNALGETSEPCLPHPEYPSLGKEVSERQHQYRALFYHHVEAEIIDEIRQSGNKDEIEQLTGRRARPANMGRPVLG